MAGDKTRQPSQAMPVYIAPAPGAAVTNIPANGNTLLHTGPGYANSILVNTAGVTSSIKLYDGLSAAGTLLGTWSTLAQGQINIGNIPFTTGLFAVTAGGTPADVTVGFVPA